ncbi:MAG: hypothetical protein ACMG6S_13930 [Byssovorax sp.]
MNRLSCTYCSFNALQYGPLGLSVGYCVQHHVVLRRADETTCARQLRKDLSRESREAAHAAHGRRYLDLVQFIDSHESAEETSDPHLLEEDPVGDVATSYGLLDSKIASLYQLRQIPGVRAELAMLGLGRGYVRWCFRRDGSWTSGLHLFWWTRRRLGRCPKVHISDFRTQTAASLERQFELAAWSVVMLRLHFMSDVAAAAPDTDDVSALANLVELAAEACATPNLEELLAWIHAEGEPLLLKSFPEQRYEALRRDLHKGKEVDDSDAG